MASIYEFVTRPDDTEIEQDLKLRIVPFTATLKFVPTGRDARFQPYIGAGIAALLWSYSETGEFVDPVTTDIFRDSFTADGTEVAPVIFGGLRAPIGASMMLGGEVRYQKADAELARGGLPRRPPRPGRADVPGESDVEVLDALRYEHHAPSFAHAREAGQKRRLTPCAFRQHVAAFGDLLDQDPPHVVARMRERGEPEIAVAFVQEVAQREAVRATVPACSAPASPCSPSRSRRRPGRAGSR